MKVLKLNVLLLLFVSVFSFANAFTAKDSLPNYDDYIYIELLGDGMVGSINFENILYSQKKWELSYLIGMAYSPKIKDISEFYGFGEIFNLKAMYALRGRHKIGLSMGFAYYLLNDDILEYEIGLLSTGFNYKYSFAQSKFYLGAKIGVFHPVIVDENIIDVRRSLPVYIGLGLGIAL